jgi:hypothetical protein
MSDRNKRKPAKKQRATKRVARKQGFIRDEVVEVKTTFGIQFTVTEPMKYPLEQLRVAMKVEKIEQSDRTGFQRIRRAARYQIPRRGS